MFDLPPKVETGILCLFATLALASVIAIVFKFSQSEDDFQELLSRIQTWFLIVAIFSAALLWSVTAVIVFLGFTSFLALKEFLSMTPTRRADRRVLFYAYLAVVVQYYFAATGRFGMFMVFIPVMMFAWLPTRMWMIGHTKGFLRAAGTLHWALMVTVFSISHAAFLLVVEVGESPRVAPAAAAADLLQPGPALLVFLILMLELSDLFQFVWGKLLGHEKVAPTVSPSKTYAGFIGGLLFTVAMAAVTGPAITLMNTTIALAAGLLIAIAGFAGDLCMSALKRDLNIKDFGASLPGHGGVLDRVDSLIFAAPLFFHFVNYCYVT